MSSRKSSSRGSRKSRSSRKSQSLSANNNKEINQLIEKSEKVGTKDKTGSNIFSLLMTLIIQGSIIYYLYNLEDKDCNCIRDWRHNFIKYYSMTVIVISLLTFILNDNKKIILYVNIILFSLTLVNLYAFFTYIGDLNKTKCSCAIDKQPTLNSFMNFLRWLQLIGVIIVIILIVFAILFMKNMFTTVMSSVKN